MSLDSSPLSPRPTPLLHPTDPVPGRKAALIGGSISVVLAAVIIFVTLRLGTQIIFLPTGLNANANAVVDQLQQIQGFSDYWTHSYDINSFHGYTDASVNQKIMSNEASYYHMNLVVITITADVVTNSGTDVIFDRNDPNFAQYDIDTYQDATYMQMVQLAQHAGLTPVFRLDVRVVQDLQTRNYANTTIGSTWSDSQQTSIAYETQWFASYTRFAVHYAILARQLGVPLIIIGSDLAFIATDNTLTKTPKAVVWGTQGEKCSGRRDCEWRYVIDAIHNSSYKLLGSKRTTAGANYSGRLTFASTITYDPTGSKGYLPTPEWSTITWWDKLDAIGIDAFFPLTNGIAEPTITQLTQAWTGTLSASQTPPSPYNQPANIVDALQKLSAKYGKRILFTAAGYESLSGCTGNPGTDTTGTTEDDNEQQTDMTALLKVFTTETWWLGVIWSADYPVWPRANLTRTDSGNNAGLVEPTYSTNTEWAGKPGGEALHNFYSVAPLTDALWANL